MHAGPTPLIASLSRRYHILGYRRIVRSITRGYITCRRTSARTHPQMLGQLPIERVTPDLVFNKVGVAMLVLSISSMDLFESLLSSGLISAS